MDIGIEGGTLTARLLPEDNSREQLLGSAATLARECTLRGCDSVFVDLTALGGPIDAVDRILLAARLAEVWPDGVRLAALALPEQVNRVIEHIAGNRGIEIRAFTDRDEAFAWLAAARSRAN